MILYRKSPHLRVKRSSYPAPPFWFGAAIAPYGARRAEPVAIDYIELRASSADRLEVAVSDNVTSEITRSNWRQRTDAAVLIDAAEAAETVFRRGEEALAAIGESGYPAIHLVSARGCLPATVPSRSAVAIAAWPPERRWLEPMFIDARDRGLDWGVVVPVMFPVTTDLPTLEAITHLARSYRAGFLAALPVDLDPTAKQALARSLSVADDDDRYAMLFHSDLDPIHTATERHLAALAHEAGLSDFVVPPTFGERTNWNAAVVLTLAATRMLAMEYETELAGTLARSARVVVDLDKPLTRIAEAANLSIVDALDEVSVDILTEWLESGRSVFVERVNARWRLRRDAGV